MGKRFAIDGAHVYEADDRDDKVLIYFRDNAARSQWLERLNVFTKNASAKVEVHRRTTVSARNRDGAHALQVAHDVKIAFDALHPDVATCWAAVKPAPTHDFYGWNPDGWLYLHEIRHDEFRDLARWREAADIVIESLRLTERGG